MDELHKSDAFRGVAVGLVVSLGMLRTLLKDLRVEGRRWWIASDPQDALANGSITVGFGDQRCIDPLNVALYRIPVIDGDSTTGIDHMLLLFEPSAIGSQATGYYLKRGCFIRDCPIDFEDFFAPVQDALLRRLQSQG